MSKHEIFHKPYKINIQYEERPTPENYRRYPSGANLGETMKVWKVQNEKVVDEDPGLVSNPNGFDDAPDAEIISAGLNHKGPNSVAIGRHANFFHWGFFARPSEMTEEAKKCFVNAVCYIKKFDGQQPIARRVARGRYGAISNASILAHLVDNPMPGYDAKKSVARSITIYFPKYVREEVGTEEDIKPFIGFYEKNLEYVYTEEDPKNRMSSFMFHIDQDARKLGISNRSVKLLDTCITMLETGKDVETAKRLLGRYTTESFETAAQWRTWLDTHRDQLFFSDLGGYKFFIAPEPVKDAVSQARVD